MLHLLSGVAAGGGYLAVLIAGGLYLGAGFFKNPKKVIQIAKKILIGGAIAIIIGMSLSFAA